MPSRLDSAESQGAASDGEGDAGDGERLEVDVDLFDDFENPCIQALRGAGRRAVRRKAHLSEPLASLSRNRGLPVQGPLLSLHQQLRPRPWIKHETSLALGAFCNLRTSKRSIVDAPYFFTSARLDRPLSLQIYN